MPKPIIKVEGISKTFISKERKKLFSSKKKTVHALRSIDLEIYDGEFFGLLGPNGAGKTTLIKCLTTLLLPTRGTAWVNSYNIDKNEDEVRASLGCMLMGERGLYWKLTGRENLDFFGAIYHVPVRVRKRRIEELVSLLNMKGYIDRTVETYSSGQKMMTAFAKALINNAPILFLDEPTVTMDVHAARELRKLVKDLNREGHTIIYTTHLMQEADELCDRVAIIDKGRIIALGTPSQLKAMLKAENVVNVEGVIPHAVMEKLRALPGIKEAVVKSETGGRSKVGILCEGREMLPKIIETMVKNNAAIEYIKPQEVTLEDVFIELTGRALSMDTKQGRKS